MIKVPEKIIDVLLKAERPVYIYDSENIKANCQTLKAIPYSNKKIHFASMANSGTRFLEIIRTEGLGVFVNSAPHLKKVREIGFGSEEIVFTASAIDEQTMQYVADNAGIVNLDSVNQLKQWSRIFLNKRAGLRINLTVDDRLQVETRAGAFIGKESRLGIDESVLEKIHDKQIISGLHIYIGTDILDVDHFIYYYQKLIKLAKQFPDLEYIDVGGGFGLDDSGENRFDFEKYGVRITELMNDLTAFLNKDITLIIEPGRIVGGEAGYFACNVTDVKRRNEKQLICTNASSTQFTRPLFYPEEAFHPVSLFDINGKQKNSVQLVSSVSGCSTYSRDYLAHNTLLPEANIGDIIVFGNAGSYCASSYTKFLGFPEPEEIYI